jgi:hypothetical protein
MLLGWTRWTSCLRENTISMVNRFARNPHCDSGYTRSGGLILLVSWRRFSHDAEERDPTIVVAVAAVTLVIVERDDPVANCFATDRFKAVTPSFLTFVNCLWRLF